MHIKIEKSNLFLKKFNKNRDLQYLSGLEAESFFNGPDKNPQNVSSLALFSVAICVLKNNLKFFKK